LINIACCNACKNILLVVEKAILIRYYKQTPKTKALCESLHGPEPFLTQAVDTHEWTEDQFEDGKLGLQALWLTKYMIVSSIGASECECQPDIAPAPATPFATWRAQRQRVIIITDLSRSTQCIEC